MLGRSVFHDLTTGCAEAIRLNRQGEQPKEPHCRGFLLRLLLLLVILGLRACLPPAVFCLPLCLLPLRPLLLIPLYLLHCVGRLARESFGLALAFALRLTFALAFGLATATRAPGR